MAELTPLALAALALLEERPMHPYEMFQTLVSRAEDRLVKVRPGSLYHTVDRMAREGLVRATGTEREGNRPERTTYEITDAGTAALAGRLIDVIGKYTYEFPIFPLALSESHNLDGTMVVELLERRIHEMNGALSYLQAGVTDVTAKQLPEAYWIDISYQHALLTAEIQWTTDFVARLRDGDIVWQPELAHLKKAHHS